MNNPTTTFSLLFCLIFVVVLVNGKSAEVVEKRKLYIVYLGDRQHDDPALTEKSHHDLLSNVVRSTELASELMVTNYKHSFSGFAAKLSKSEAEKIADIPQVVHVIPSRKHKLQTTRSWDYLGIPSPQPNNLLGKANEGEDVIIGVLDTGIWPESQSFNDEGLGPIPSRWKGACLADSGDGSFDPSKHCNKKIIGARYFMEAFRETLSEEDTVSFTRVNLHSARGNISHGTHVASIAAGRYVRNVTYYGVVGGTARGGAPKARLAIYKVCWASNEKDDGCESADVLKAMDQAIEDGVDIIQASIATSGAIFPDINPDPNLNGLAIGTFHAMTKGISVVFGAGNAGPNAETVLNVEPWIITVGAIYHDRSYPTPLTLGNNVTLVVPGFVPGFDAGFLSLYMTEDGSCDGIDKLMIANKSEVFDGKVIVCFNGSSNVDPPPPNAAGFIIVKTGALELKLKNMPYIEVSNDVGTAILNYNQSTSDPIIEIGSTKAVIDSGWPKVASFSARGPNPQVPEILKPDIVAPGGLILAAGVPSDPTEGDRWELDTGTSMAAPHISGIVALIKQAHPEWSPAAIKSAIMTTAWTTNRYGLPIFDESTKRVASHFDIGAGIVNPNSAYDPGLVYDMDVSDYVNYLCGMGYSNSSISKVLTNHPTRCPTKRPSILDLNLPSITIPSLQNSTTIYRTVTNVGLVNSVYKAVIETPIGTMVSVTPKVLVFNSKSKKKSFKVSISAISSRFHSQGYFFGSLTWTDGEHNVRSPISVRL